MVELIMFIPKDTHSLTIIHNGIHILTYTKNQDMKNQ